MTNPTVTAYSDLAVCSEHDRTDEADEAMMSMLHDHVPLSLLCDLTDAQGPGSAQILAEEGEPTTRWWEQ